VGARKVHVDIDLSEINKNVRVDIALLADVNQVLRAIESRVEPQGRTPWIEHIRILKGDASVRDIQQLPHEGRLFAAHVIHDLWRITEGKAIVVTDVGQHQMWEAQYYKHDFARRLITSGGLGTMGFAVPAALGAKHAQPDEEVWVICGDGGFQMTQAELATAAQEGIKINIAIINNGYLGMVRQWQQFFYEGRYSATPLKSPDFVKLAEAHGLLGLRVKTREELPAIVQRARTEKGTVVVDFRVEQEDSVYPMVPTGADLTQMIQRPSAIVETPKEDSAKDPMRVLGPAPVMSEQPKPTVTERTVIALVEDKPGVLNRVASLFRRRAFNITSLTVGRTHKPGISRLTLTTEATEDNAKRIEAHLYKLLEVMYVKDVTHMACVESDLALIKVHVDDSSRTEVLDICRNYGARAVDATGGTLMIEITASREQLDSILVALRPYEIEEMVRTGMIAMTRGPLHESN
jgi:acetolactate synthase small subunit